MRHAHYGLIKSIIIFTALILCALTVTQVSYASDNDHGFIMPEDDSIRLVDTDVSGDPSGSGSGGGNWGPDGPSGFIPGGIPDDNTSLGGPETGSPDAVDEDEDRGFWGSIADGIINGARTAGEGLRDAGSATWDFMTEQGKRGIEEAGNIWDSAVEGAGNLWDSTVDRFNSAREWMGERWDALGAWGQDLVKTIGSVLLVAGAAVGIALIGLVTWPVALVAIGGAALAAGIYFGIHGGTGSFNWLHSLLWAAGGGLLGGAAQALGLIAGGAKALGSALAWGKGSAQLLWLKAFKLGLGNMGALSFVKFLGTSALKLFASGASISMITDIFTNIIPALFTGGDIITFREFMTNAVFTGAATTITFGLGRGFLTAPVRGKVFLSGYGATVFGSAELLKGYVLNGTFEVSNFILGAIIGATAVPVFGAAKRFGELFMKFNYSLDKRRIRSLSFGIDIINSMVTSKFQSLTDKLIINNEYFNKENEINKEKIENKYYKK